MIYRNVTFDGDNVSNNQKYEHGEFLWNPALGTKDDFKNLDKIYLLIA